MESINNMLRVEITDGITHSRQTRYKYSGDINSNEYLKHEKIVLSDFVDDEIYNEEISVNKVPIFESKFEFSKIKGQKINPDDNKIMLY